MVGLYIYYVTSTMSMEVEHLNLGDVKIHLPNYFAVNHNFLGIEDVKGIAPQNLAATYHDILL